MTVFTMAAFSSYGRPKEMTGLGRKDLLPLAPGLCQYWTLVSCPSELDEASKTRESDIIVVLDLEELQWMNPCWSVLRQGLPDACVWNFSYPEYTAEFRRAAAEAGLTNAVPFQSRHSGASWDRLKKQWSQEEGQTRTMKSLVRYEKHGRITQSSLLLSEAVRAEHLAAVRLAEEAVHYPGEGGP